MKLNREQRRKQTKLKQKVFGKTVGKALIDINDLNETSIVDFIEHFKQINKEVANDKKI